MESEEARGSESDMYYAWTLDILQRRKRNWRKKENALKVCRFMPTESQRSMHEEREQKVGKIERSGIKAQPLESKNAERHRNC